MCAVIGALIRAAAQPQSLIKLTAFRTAAAQEEGQKTKARGGDPKQCTINKTGPRTWPKKKKEREN